MENCLKGSKGDREQVWLTSTRYNFLGAYHARRDDQRVRFYVDPAGPDYGLVPLSLNSGNGWSREGPRDVEEDVAVYIQESVDILEKAQEIAKARSSQRWLWLVQQHVEWDAAGILMTCLVKRSSDIDLMERAEIALTTFFNHWEKQISASQEVRWEDLQKLRSKLEARRRKALDEAATRRSNTDPDCLSTSAALAGWDDLVYLGQLDFEQTGFWL